MVRKCALLFLLPLLALVPTATADEALTGLDEVAQAIKAAVDDGNYVALDTACTRARELAAAVPVDELDAVVHALGDGVKSRDVSITLLAVKTLGDLGTPAAWTYLSRLLSPSRRPDSDELKVHLAAIEAAGAIGSRDFVLRLQKLILHDDTQIAVAAATALGGLDRLEERERIALVWKVANQLGRMELRRPAKHVDKIHLGVVKSAIVDCLRQLTKEPELETADDFRDWAREAERDRAVT